MKNKLAYGVWGMFLAIGVVIGITSIYSQPVSADGGQPGQGGYGCGSPYNTGYLDGNWCPVESSYPPSITCDIATAPVDNPNGCLNLCYNDCAQRSVTCGWNLEKVASCMEGCYAGITDRCTGV